MSTQPPKIENGFDVLRQHLLSFDLLPADHPAVVAAIRGIDEELRMRQRDAKLHDKFMNDAVRVRASEASQIAPQPLHMHTTQNFQHQNNDETMIDDWHEINEGEESCSDTNGRNIAKEAVTDLSNWGITCGRPLDAIAVVLHAAMQSKMLGFRCTTEETTSRGGFAAPIRELPDGQFLPTNWDATPGTVSLRYRKKGIGSLLMKVNFKNDECDGTVQVTLAPSNSCEPTSEVLVFPLSLHFNLESWQRATQQQTRISPILHYKRLAELIDTFCNKFDVGIDVSGQEKLPYVDCTVNALPSNQDAMLYRSYDYNDAVAPRIENSFPFAQPRPRDFGGDLLPGGIIGPTFGSMDPGQAGNLMGPNHPAFGSSHFGPGSMTPRFDPFGPPGGPQDTRPRRGRPGGTGNPNPDHLRPPSNLGNNMFM